MLKKIEEESQSLLEDSIDSLNYDLPSDLNFDHLPEASNSVLATSISFKISNEYDNSKPNKVASDIVENVDNSKFKYVKTIENTGPYINIFASSEWYSEVIEKTKNNDYGGNFINKNIDISIEHTSVNPTGPLHIGRVRNSIIGDSLANILDFSGYDVTKDYYVNNAGLQVAMLVWGVNNYNEEDLPKPKYNEYDSYDLVRYYRKASEDLDNDILSDIQKNNIENPEKFKEYEVINILKSIENGNENVINKVNNIVNKMLKSQINSLNYLGVTFDNFNFESDYMGGEKMEELLDSLKESELSDKKNGAWVMGLQTQDINNNFVFERSNGTTLYGTRDILYHIDKISKYDESLLVLGEDQELHIKSVKAILNILDYNSSSIEPIYHSFVEGMSTRKGEGEFLEKVVEKAEEKSKSIIDESEVNNIDKIAKQVAVGSLRYNLLSKNRNQPIKFDIDEVVSVESGTGTSIQYSYTRLKSILDKIDLKEEFNPNLLESEIEYKLIEKLSQFPSVIQDCINHKEPNKLANYVNDLHILINQFYRDCNIKNEENPEKQKTWISMVKSSINVLELSLDLLNIPKPNEM